MTNDHDSDDASRIEAEVAGGHDTHGTHGTHDAHENDGGGHGHGADPNAGVVVGEPPTPAWVMTAAGIAALTIAICVVLAVMLHDAAGTTGGTPSEEPAHGLAPLTATIARV